jgi:RNA polymerase sigma-70 factor, ECF subfamily
MAISHGMIGYAVPVGRGAWMRKDVGQTTAASPGRAEKLQADALLMEKVAARDEAAVRLLVHRLWDRIHAIAYHMTYSSEDAKDLTQESMIELCKSASTYQAQGSLEGWAKVIAVRTMTRKLGRARWKWRFIDFKETQVVEELPLPRTERTDEVVVQERRRRVKQLLKKLSPKLQAAIILKVVFEHTAEEIGEIMRLKPDAVRYLLKKARSKLVALAERDPGLKDVAQWSLS